LWVANDREYFRKLRDSVPVPVNSEWTEDEIRKLKTVNELRILYGKFVESFKTRPSMANFIVIFYLYPFHDPSIKVMRNDLASLQYVSGINTYNDGIITLRDHKTSTKKGDKIIKVPRELSDIINLWISIKGVKPSENIITASKVELGNSLRLKIGLGTQMLRKIWVNEFRKDTHEEHDKKMSKLEEDAEDMGHSFATEHKYYYKKPKRV
jgi:hypothetical protein